jgi:hypothetical protein
MNSNIDITGMLYSKYLKKIIVKLQRGVEAALPVTIRKGGNTER